MHRLSGLGLVAALFFFLAMPAEQSFAGSCGNNYHVRINNNTGYEIYYVYPRNADQYDFDWSWDLLGDEDTIPPYSSIVVNVDDGDCYCVFDLQAQTEDGVHSWQLNDSNICRLENWNLND